MSSSPGWSILFHKEGRGLQREYICFVEASVLTIAVKFLLAKFFRLWVSVGLFCSVRDKLGSLRFDDGIPICRIRGERITRPTPILKRRRTETTGSKLERRGRERRS